MNCEIISVGTELLLGEIVNLDAQTISQGLSEQGVNVYYHTVVGDNPSGSKRRSTLPKGGPTSSSRRAAWGRRPTI